MRGFGHLSSTSSFKGRLVVESNLLNAISWVLSFTVAPIQVEFRHVGRMANGFREALAKQEANRSIDLVASSL